MSLFAVLSIFICFLLSAFFSGAETGSYMLNRIRLQYRVVRRRHAAVSLLRVLQDSHIFVFTVLVGNNLAVYVLTKQVTDLFIGSEIEAFNGGLLFGFFPLNAEIAATFTLMLPLFILGEVGPKNLFRKRADLLMYRLADPLRFFVLLFYPFTWPLKKLFNLLTHGMGEESAREMHRLSSDGLKEYFSVGEKDGLLSSSQNRMMENVTSMHSMSVRQLMVPFGEIPQLPATATVADLRRVSARHGTAYATLMEKNRAVGHISLFSVINRRLADGEPVRPYAEEMLQIEEHRSLKSAFYRLRRNPRHLAVIVDARHHPVGLLRLEDIARFIAGS